MGTFAETAINSNPSITVYCLLIKENKLPFSVSICSKQTEVVLSIFRLQQTVLGEGAIPTI
jgi:hypothetical protein